MNNKTCFILFTAILTFIVCSNSFATETRYSSNSKLDSLIRIQSETIHVGDSTIIEKKPFQRSAIIGFTASVFSILSWSFQLFGVYPLIAVFNPLIFGIVGLVFSIIALRRIKKTKKRGKKLAKAGIILTIAHALGFVGLLILIVLALSNFS